LQMVFDIWSGIQAMDLIWMWPKGQDMRCPSWRRAWHW